MTSKRADLKAWEASKKYPPAQAAAHVGMPEADYRESIGRAAKLFKNGEKSAEIYASMWDARDAGTKDVSPFNAGLENLRKQTAVAVALFGPLPEGVSILLSDILFDAIDILLEHCSGSIAKVRRLLKEYEPEERG